MSRRAIAPSRRPIAFLAALVVATGLVILPPSASEVRAATPDLTIVSTARYDVQPEAGRVRVTADLVLTNHKRDTTTKRFYFDQAFLSVQPSSSGYGLSGGGGGTPRVAVSKRTSTYTLLQLNLGARLYSGKSASYRLVFDIVDKGGAATRDVRIGASLVAFPVWAFATTSTAGSSVRVTFPKGFEVQVEAGDMPAPTTTGGGEVVLETGKLAKPLEFYAYLVGDRASAHSERIVTVDVGGTAVELTIQAWPDDEAWSERVGGLVSSALPLLAERIGLPWPRDGGLIVREAVTRSTGGYAGLFDPEGGEVEVAYYADGHVVLHEAAHAWFNGGLLADRWANEAFASYYGAEVAGPLKVKASGDALTPAIEKARIPLNAWGPIGREGDATETYGYAASVALARAIAERAGDDGLRAVWADAAARARYDAVVTAAGDWKLPRPVRDAMRAWQFEQATTLLDDAEAVLAQRRAILSAAAAAGLTAPTSLQTAFETPDGFAGATTEAAAELEAIARYVDAAAARPAGVDTMMTLGLWGSDPDADLDRAKTAFAAGDLAGSAGAAASASTLWAGAADLGRGRAVSLMTLAVAVVLAVILAAVWLRGRRRRGHGTMRAEDIGA